MDIQRLAESATHLVDMAARSARVAIFYRSRGNEVATAKFEGQANGLLLAATQLVVDASGVDEVVVGEHLARATMERVNVLRLTQSDEDVIASHARAQQEYGVLVPAL